jgi:hypothetical protein
MDKLHARTPLQTRTARHKFCRRATTCRRKISSLQNLRYQQFNHLRFVEAIDTIFTQAD